MDHLPIPRRLPSVSHPEIPYLCQIWQTPYDGKGFLGYPSRVRPGWIKNDQLLPAALAAPQEEVRGLLQAYLWFGIGQEVLGQELFNEDKMTTVNSQGQAILTTKQLPELCERWVLTQQKKEQSERTYKHLSLCFRTIYSVVAQLDIGEEDPRLDRLLVRSFMGLCEYLMMTATIGYGIHGIEWGSIRVFGACSILGAASYGLDSMREDGWCPSEIERVDGTMQMLASIQYCTMLEQPAAGRAHGDCGEATCAAYQINPATYETRHATPLCQCSKVHAEEEKILEILKRDKIPLLRVSTPTGSENVLLEVVESGPDTPYVAISHVWADGMGDPKSNALPGCQLRRLQALINALPTPSPPQRELPPDLEADLLDRFTPEAPASSGSLPSSSLGLSDGVRLLMKAPAEGSLGPLIRNVLIECASSERFNRALGCMIERLLAEDEIRGLVRSLLEDFPLVMPRHAHTECASQSNIKSTYNRVTMKRLLGLGFKIWSSPVLRAELMQCSISIQNNVEPSLSKAVDDLTFGLFKADRSEIGPSGIATTASIDFARPELRRHDPHNTSAEVDTSSSQASPQPLLLWIDTICCPIQPKWAKNLSIGKLRATYKNATHVLVIDSYLTSVSASLLSDLEKLFRILLSAWTRRVWTLQEGVLARNLWFQFADGALDFYALFGYWQKHHSWEDKIFLPDITRMGEELCYFGRRTCKKEHISLRIRQALEHRSVSYDYDEAICIANLAEIPLAGIFEAGESAPNRMQIVWKQMPDIPSGLVFNGLPRLNMKGYRWAPASFLGHQKIAFCPQEKPGKLRTKGLEVKFPGFFFIDGVNSLAPTVDFQDESGEWYEVSIGRPTEAQSEDNSNYQRQFDAIILSHWPKAGCQSTMDGAHPACLEGNVHNSVRGITVALEDCDSGIFIVSSRCHVQVALKPTGKSWNEFCFGAREHVRNSRTNGSELDGAAVPLETQTRRHVNAYFDDILQKEISSGELPPGFRLPENAREKVVPGLVQAVEEWITSGRKTYAFAGVKMEENQLWVVD